MGALVALALVGCGAGARAAPGVVTDGASSAGGEAPRELAALPPHGPGGLLWDVREARARTLEELAAWLDGVEVVYVGEHHDRAADHEVERAVIEALASRPGALWIGMEMFQRPFQPALDAYVEGEIDEPTLLARTEWAERWGMDFAAYRPILEFARAHRLRVVALNARREVSRAIARDGLAGLDPALRAELPELDLTDAAHRARVEAALAGHGAMDPARLEHFYEAQVVWDETMADTVAAALSGPDAPARLVVLAGRMHVEAGNGIPRRAARRGAAPFRIILPSAPDERAEDQTAADVVAPVE